MRQTDAVIRMLGEQHVDTLRAGIRDRKPDAADRVRLQIRKVESELAPVVLRRAIVERCKAAGELVQPALEVVLDANIAALRGKLRELHGVLRETRASAIADHGATQEVAARPLPTRDIPEEFHQTAEDLRSGWIAKTARAQAARMRFDEVPGEGGQVAERLEIAFDRWHAEMARQRIMVWPVLLIVCEGKSALEAARLRGMDPRAISFLMQAGLIVFEAQAAISYAVS
jgi:hypothetical protein